tara:strand:- start:865 stop:1323 length:459 start_codon:yes stop_codon:yes gene_type:complete
MGKVMKTSSVGIDLIKEFEGCELKAYRCSGDVLTWGYGHTRYVVEGEEITQEQADNLLIKDIESFEHQVNRLIDVEVNQNQFDALISWTFNLGCGSLKSSTLLKVLNAGDYDNCAEQILRWDKAGGKVLAGLTRRRKAEAALFDANLLERED